MLVDMENKWWYSVDGGSCWIGLFQPASSMLGPKGLVVVSLVSLVMNVRLSLSPC